MGKLQALSKIVRQKSFRINKRIWMFANTRLPSGWTQISSHSSFVSKLFLFPPWRNPIQFNHTKHLSKFFPHRSSPPEPAAATVLHIEGPLHHKVSFWASLFGHPANLANSVRIFVFTKWAPQVVPQEAPGHHNPWNCLLLLCCFLKGKGILICSLLV